MPKITRPETLIEVGVKYEGHAHKKVAMTFKKSMVKVASNGDVEIALDKRQTTQIIKALKSQRRRKHVK